MSAESGAYDTKITFRNAGARVTSGYCCSGALQEAACGPAEGSPQALYVEAVAACEAMPIRATGTTYYYCDCQTGAEAGCVAGANANFGTFGCSAAHPCQTFAHSAILFNTMGAGDTVAYCRGGSWAIDAQVSFGNAACSVAGATFAARRTALAAAATATTCDLRDYTAAWGGTAKPRITQTGNAYTMRFTDVAQEGARILNLDLRGPGTGPGDTANTGTRGIITQGNVHDSLVCGVSFDRFYLAAAMLLDAPVGQNWVWRGNRFTNTSSHALLLADDAGVVDANYFDNDGTTAAGEHTVYLYGANPNGFTFINNEIDRSSTACGGTLLVVHDQFASLTIENNDIDAGAEEAAGCYAIGVDSGDYPRPGYYRNLAVRRNRISGANVGIHVGNAPSPIIESNVVVGRADVATTCIDVPSWHTRVAPDPEDDATTAALVRNNTCYIPGAGTTSTGIYVGSVAEGTAHVIANNVVRFASGAGTCFRTPMAAGSYAYVGTNACNGTWSTSFDATTRITSDPQFTNAAAGVFTLSAGSPLRGAGSSLHGASTGFDGAARADPPSIGAYE